MAEGLRGYGGPCRLFLFVFLVHLIALPFPFLWWWLQGQWSHFFTAIITSKCRDYFYLLSLLLAIFSVNTVTYSPIAITKSFHCCTLHSSICYSSSFFFPSWLSSCFSQFLVERLMIYMYVCTPMYTHTYTDTYINTCINTYVHVAHNLLYTVNTRCVFPYRSQSCHFQLCNSTAGLLVSSLTDRDFGLKF